MEKVNQIRMTRLADVQARAAGDRVVVFGGGGFGGGLAAANARLPRLPSPKVDAITWSDDEHTFDVTVSKNGDQRDLHLVAKGADGTIVFDGPINTDDEKKGLPKEISEKLNTPAIAPVLDIMRGNTPLKLPAAPAQR
jgi:hypothetical protein